MHHTGFDRTLLITSASRGIGTATARLAAARGWDVAINYRQDLAAAQAVAAEGVRVNAVRLGIIDTDIHASGGQPGRAAQMGPQVPMQRAGTALEVAKAIQWLLSPEASYTTGSIVDVAGGR